jgi:hypothetical protein
MIDFIASIKMRDHRVEVFCIYHVIAIDIQAIDFCCNDFDRAWLRFGVADRFDD